MAARFSCVFVGAFRLWLVAESFAAIIELYEPHLGHLLQPELPQHPGCSLCHLVSPALWLPGRLPAGLPAGLATGPYASPLRYVASAPVPLAEAALAPALMAAVRAALVLLYRLVCSDCSLDGRLFPPCQGCPRCHCRHASYEVKSRQKPH